MDLDIAISPCPNDTYIFSGIASGNVVVPNCSVRMFFHDVETLNELAFEGRYEVTKLSFGALLALGDKYRILSAGSAFGYGCGPLLVGPSEFKGRDINSLRIAVPGKYTTANLLLNLCYPDACGKVYVRYDDVFRTIESGQADVGIIIHESRFLYEKRHLNLLKDLGQWWEEYADAPIPLGAIAVRSDLPVSVDDALNAAIRESIAIARNDPDAVMKYIMTKSIEKDREIVDQHINMFVNDFTSDMGVRGRSAYEILKKKSREAGLFL